MHKQNELALAIVAAHGSRLGLPITQSGQLGSAPPVLWSSEAPIYRAAKQACGAMGFIEIDAEAVALAWQAQHLRTGEFQASQWPDQAVDFGMSPWPRALSFAPCPQQLGLYAVLPDAAWVERMAQAGVATLQLRYKSHDSQAIVREVRNAIHAVKGTKSLLFINDHWQAAIDEGAYGVHLGQEDLALADLAAIRNAGLRLGLSSHGYAEMLYADSFSPSYIAMGAVFPTTLKRMATAAQGTGRLQAYTRLMRDYPLVAIGGIDANSMNEVLSSGVGSVAVVRALVAADQPEKVAAKLQKQIQARLGTSGKTPLPCP